MIDIASRATKRVIVPDRRVTRREIMDLFKTQMTHLRTRLNVSCLFSGSPTSDKTWI